MFWFGRFYFGAPDDGRFPSNKPGLSLMTIAAHDVQDCTVTTLVPVIGVNMHCVQLTFENEMGSQFRLVGHGFRWAEIT